MVLVETTWSISPSEIRTFLEPKLLQYLASTEVSEIADPIAELGRPDLNPHIIEALVIQGIERNVRLSLCATLSALVLFLLHCKPWSSTVPKGLTRGWVALQDLDRELVSVLLAALQTRGVFSMRDMNK